MPIFHLAGLAMDNAQKLQNMLPSAASAANVVVVTGADGKISATFFPDMSALLGFVAENSANKGIANGYASLGADGKVPLTQLPDLGMTAAIVADITERDALTDPVEGFRVFVLDAAADATVTVGAAEYIYHDSAWVKILEIESMDLAVTMANISGLTEALAGKSDTDHSHPELHTHANKDSILDKFTLEDGTNALLFDGNPIGSGGVDGIDGKTIITGTVDPTTEGVDGDYYINQTTWHIWYKEAGVWEDKDTIKGAKGDPGDPGDPGAAGSVIFGLANDPTTEGVEGDWAINTSTWHYWHKESGIWEDKGSVQGTDGTLIYTVSGIPDAGTGVDGDYAIDQSGWHLWHKETGTWIDKGSLRGTDATSPLIQLTPFVCNSYTNDTWTTVYTNSGSTIQGLYLTSLTNRSDAAVTVSLRLVDSSDTELHRIVDAVSLAAYSGLENAYSQYPVPPTAKIQFQASAASCEALLSVGLLPNAAHVVAMNPATANTWTDIYDNSAGLTGFRLALVSVANTSSNAANVDMRVTNSDGTTTIYHVIPPLTLEGRKGVENHTGYFVLDAAQKLQIYAADTSVQFLVFLLNNETVG